MLARDFGLSKEAFDAFPKGETYIQAGPVIPLSKAIDAPWPKESTHKFSLLADAPTTIEAYAAIVTWSTDHRVRA
jgi:oxalate decarboxylase